jgi:hypothetical protein
METVSVQIDTARAPLQEDLARLDTIHPVNQRTAEVLIAELGVDLTVSPPPSMRPAGRACAPATTRVPDPPRQSLAVRGPDRGSPGGTCPLPHGGLRGALSPRQGAPGATHQEPGADDDDRRHAERVRHRAIQTLDRQGYRVTLEPAA